MLYILGPGGVGYMLPKYWVTKRLQQRKEEITDGFPDSLDMMLVCIEAGQSMDQSIIRVANEIKASYPALAEEFPGVTLYDDYETMFDAEKPDLVFIATPDWAHFKPVMAANALQSAGLLGDACRSFEEHCASFYLKN